MDHKYKHALLKDRYLTLSLPLQLLVLKDGANPIDEINGVRSARVLVSRFPVYFDAAKMQPPR